MTTEHAPRRVVGYCRISKATDESTSIARQRALIQDTCRSRGWTPVEIIEDVDISASKTGIDRPGLARVREIVASGRADVVMVWRVDRAARSVSNLSALVDEWAKHGAALVSCTEAFDTTTTAGMAMMQMLGIFAQMEAATLRDRVTAARAALVKARRWPGGVPPYGYRSTPNPHGAGRVLELDPVEVAFLRTAADIVLGGRSVYQAVKALNAAGSRPHRAPAWSITSLRIALTQEAVLGRMTHKGHVVTDDDGLPVQVWEPALPEDDVHRLRALSAPTRTPGGERKRRARLLSGLLRCSTCGANMRVNRTGGAKPVVRYSCFGSGDGTGCTRSTSIVAERLEEHVERLFLDAVGRFEVVEVQETVPDRAELAAVEAAIKAASEELRDADGDREDDLIADLRKLKARRRELEAAPAEAEVTEVSTGQTFAEAWNERDVDGRRDLLSSAVEHIVIKPGVRGRRGIDPERVDVHWHR